MIPELGPIAAQAYPELEPLTFAEERFDYPLAKYVQSLGQPLDELEGWVRDTPDGKPGWSLIVDIDRAPVLFLPWLGQFVGVRVSEALPDPEARQKIRDEEGLGRGTVPALIKAAQKYLTGNKTVLVNERKGGQAYVIGVATLATETSIPDVPRVQAALLRAKAAGLILEYETISEQTYQTVYDDWSTYQQLYDAYATYEGVLLDQLGA